MTFKYGYHTSNAEELLSSCSDLDTFDDLLADVLNQNKESFSPKTKPRRYRPYDCLVSEPHTSSSPVSENGSFCQTQINSPPTFFPKTGTGSNFLNAGTKKFCFFSGYETIHKVQKPVKPKCNVPDSEPCTSD
jgi:hypothetical protein